MSDLCTEDQRRTTVVGVYVHLYQAYRRRKTTSDDWSNTRTHIYIYICMCTKQPLAQTCRRLEQAVAGKINIAATYITNNRANTPASLSISARGPAQPVWDPQKSPPHGPVAQWIRHRPTEPGIAGSSPAGVIFTMSSGHLRL